MEKGQPDMTPGRRRRMKRTSYQNADLCRSVSGDGVPKGLKEGYSDKNGRRESTRLSGRDLIPGGPEVDLDHADPLVKSNHDDQSCRTPRHFALPSFQYGTFHGPWFLLPFKKITLGALPWKTSFEAAALNVLRATSLKKQIFARIPNVTDWQSAFSSAASLRAAVVP